MPAYDPPMTLALVTGAFSNIGASTAERLAARGVDLSTLTNRRPHGPLQGIVAHALRFDFDHLVSALRGVDAVVNTYWVRTPSHGATFDEGVDTWFVRRMPLIPVPAGGHEVQPVLLDDLGTMLADAATADGPAARTIEAAGPERYSFRDYLALIADRAGLRRRFTAVPHAAFTAGAWCAGRALRDDLVTADELRSLRSGYLLPTGEATCVGSIAAWLDENIGLLGHRYINDSRLRRESARLARAC